MGGLGKPSDKRLNMYEAIDVGTDLNCISQNHLGLGLFFRLRTMKRKQLILFEYGEAI